MYYQTKFAEVFYEEVESNNNYWNANSISCGDTYGCVSYNGDEDFYKIEITGNEDVFFDLIYAVEDEAGTIYYPLLLDNSLNEVILSWNLEQGEGVRLYYSTVILSPGTYYVCIEGYYTSDYTYYLTYAYWKKHSEAQAFIVDVGNLDFLP